MNDLYSADLTGFLPGVLAADPQTLALAQVIAAQFQRTAREIPKAILYARLDELPEPALDLLAHDLHADWYDAQAPAPVKRQILRDSVRMHRRMGTKWAVERLAEDYFGGGTVREWFEYGGQPHYFKIVVDDLDRSGLPLGRFSAMLEKVKRKSAWLELLEFRYHAAVAIALRAVAANAAARTEYFCYDGLCFDGVWRFDGRKRFYSVSSRGARTPFGTVRGTIPGGPQAVAGALAQAAAMERARGGNGAAETIGKAESAAAVRLGGTILGGVPFTAGAAATVTKDTMRHADGRVQFDGLRCWNADRIVYDC